MSLLRMGEEIIGQSARNLSKSQLATRILSTSDFPLILADVAHKSVMRGYNIQRQTFRPLVTMGTLPDYKEENIVELGNAPSLEKVNEGGEYTFGELAEGGEKIKVIKYGKKLRFTEEMLINDDLRIFSRVPEMFGQTALRLESSLFWAILTGSHLMGDAKQLFHTDHGNLAGSGADPGETTVDVADQAIRAQKDRGGKDLLEIIPEFLICGPQIGVKARKFLNTQIVATKSSDVNVFAGTMIPIIAHQITGKEWFLAAGPSQGDTIQMSYLQGMNGPEITTINDQENDAVIIKAKDERKAELQKVTK
jgi:hypothetical protein